MPFRTSTSTYLQKANFHPQMIFLAYELITQTNILLTKQRTSFFENVVFNRLAKLMVSKKAFRFRMI